MSATHGHEDRDRIKAMAEQDFVNLYLDNGGRRRGKALHCLFHEDTNPSASIHRARFHCFGCNLSLDVFAFVARTQQTDFRGALSYLSHRYGVPLNDRPLSPAERAHWARERAGLELDLPPARLWLRSAIALGEELLVVLKASFFDAPAESDVTSAELADVTKRVARWRRLDGAALVAEYRLWRDKHPELVAGMVRAAAMRQRAECRAILRYLMETGE